MFKQMAPKLRANSNQLVFLLATLVAILIFINCNVTIFIQSQPRPHGKPMKNGKCNVSPRFLNISMPRQGYLVWNNECKIPAVDPFLPEVMAIFQPDPPLKCEGKRPYVLKFYNSTIKRYILRFNESTLVENFEQWDALECCYRKILRLLDTDFNISLANCLEFRDGFEVPLDVDSLVAYCRSNMSKSIVYKEPMFFIQHRPDIAERLEQASSFHNKTKDFGVLIIGIDSISQMHLRRALPQTLEFLQQWGWYEMSGYNKMEDNTYPNLMAILTGQDFHSTHKHCSPLEQGGLNKCRFTWDDFQESGFVTAYAEDWAHGSTFHYGKKGFAKSPTDYYYFPFMYVANKIFQTMDWKSNCLKSRPKAEYTFDFITEFSSRYSNRRAFGVFWINSFSHDSYSQASSMDGRTRDFLRRLKNQNVLENFVVIFCSDHGTRFGKIRVTTTGFYDERLPFFFMSLPKHLKEIRPDFIYGLKSNKHQLISPYDVYMTLQHLLAVSTDGQHDKSKYAKSCPTCQSILTPVPKPRSCEQAGIEEHWCTCSPYIPVAPRDATIRYLTQYDVIDAMNEWLKNQTYGGLCCPLRLSYIAQAYKRLDAKSKRTYYRVLFFVGTEQFTVTFKYNKLTKRTKINVPSISRITTYRKTADCIEDSIGKKYCICRRPGQDEQCNESLLRPSHPLRVAAGRTAARAAEQAPPSGH